jgi:hypothetical protein
MTSFKQQKSNRQVILAHLLEQTEEEQARVYKMADQMRVHLHHVGEESALELAYKLCRFINHRTAGG